MKKYYPSFSHDATVVMTDVLPSLLKSKMIDVLSSTKQFWNTNVFSMQDLLKNKGAYVDNENS
jgi:hypothetical protein